MTTAIRPYAIRSKITGELVAIVRCTAPAVALRHHCRNLFQVGMADVNDGIDAQATGIAIVDAAPETEKAST